jgi:hypothetical protein
MSKLTPIHQQLTTLKNTRATVRGVTAFSALATSILVALAAVFVLDVIFELPLIPRLIVMVLAALGCFWAFTKYTQPLLGVKESEMDLALMVERQQHIDSDLVAALQFESPEAPTWGSRQLEGAVIDYVSEFGKGLNVFEGFSREQMTRRASLLGIAALVTIGFVAFAPTYASVFLNRLLLGSRHYPSRTSVERIVVNNATVLVQSQHGSLPVNLKGAQGHPMLFYVECQGELPASGTLRVRSASGGSSRPIDMRMLSLEDRAARLRASETRLAEAIEKGEIDVSEPWRQEMVALLAFDAPSVAEAIAKSDGDREKLAAAHAGLGDILAAWPGNADERGLYLGDMGRLVDDVTYSVYLGDAWTDPARISMIPLPIVELVPEIIPPKYAQAEKRGETTSTRQLSVLESSTVDLKLRCVNDKPLAAVWLTAKIGEKNERYEFKPTNDAKTTWALTDEKSPFRDIRDEIRYELQVTDEDGLHLETPIRSIIRLRPDRPPSGTAEVVHRVVLPNARPVVSYRLNDDYGIGKLALLVEIEHEDMALVSADSSNETTSDSRAPDSTITLNLHAPPKPPLPTAEQYHGAYTLDLAPLDLTKGDRLKLTLEITDYRGEAPGQVYLSDPLILEVSDESGVLAAISEADERSEERLTDIIKKQLGIGDSP